MFFFPQVWSENSQDHDDFVDDALKILRGESSDMFPESIIDQLFKDTFESDIFLTSGDDFAMDPLFFLLQSLTTESTASGRTEAS